jgi:tetratricopeptide (TPR) repeat protein
MLKRFVILFTLLCIASVISFSQSVKMFTTTQSLKDSIERKYLDSGAYNYNYFSDKWNLYIDSAIAITPDDAFLWEEKAMPYFKARKYEVGMQYVDVAVQLNPKKWLEYRGFIKCVFSKTYKDAIVDLEGAEKLNGNFTTKEHPYSFYIGLSYLALDQFDSAAFFFNKTIDVENTDGGAELVHFMDWFYLGIVNYEQKNYQTAIDYFDKALTRYSNFSEAEYYKSICMNKLHMKMEDLLRVYNNACIDFQHGYSFTEDNCIYEKYPYQLSPYMLRSHNFFGRMP